MFNTYFEMKLIFELFVAFLLLMLTTPSGAGCANILTIGNVNCNDMNCPRRTECFSSLYMFNNTVTKIKSCIDNSGTIIKTQTIYIDQSRGTAKTCVITQMNVGVQQTKKECIDYNGNVRPMTKQEEEQFAQWAEEARKRDEEEARRDAEEEKREQEEERHEAEIENREEKHEQKMEQKEARREREEERREREQEREDARREREQEIRERKQEREDDIREREQERWERKYGMK